jgi:outer membrane receptor protein involved in Fe transport
VALWQQLRKKAEFRRIALDHCLELRITSPLIQNEHPKTGEFFMKKSRLMIAGSILGLAMVTALPAYAQDSSEDTAKAPDDDEEEAEEEGTGKPILVTGSRISRPTLESAVPLTSVTVDDLTGTGEVSLGDALNDLPSLRSTFSAGNSSRFIGTAGLSLLDLRGLGTDRTLVLVNGRRHVTSTPGDNGFDVNTIPIDLVDRIDIVTGGNSAIYGSDAVAGVVNFIMRKDYDGIALRGQGGISSRGDRGTYFLSGLAGKNFADGRGNITFAAEYTRQQPLYFRQRDGLAGAFSGRCQFNASEPASDAATGIPAEPARGDGIPDSTFFCGVRNGTISNGGTIGRVGVGNYLRFDNSGNLVQDIFTTNFEAAGSTNGIGGLGLGATLRDTGSLLAEVDRYAFNVLGHFDVSDAFRPFIEAKYVRTDATGEGQPSFWQGSIPPFFGGGSNLTCDNGFLTAQALTTFRSFGICGATAPGTAIGGSGVLRGTQAQTFTMSRFNVDFGGRKFFGKRETYRAVGGVEGTFNEDWKYELALNYGRFEAVGRNDRNLYLFDELGNPDGFLLATQSVIAPAGFTGSNFVTNSAGQRVICRVNAVTNTRPDCIPINVFGNGAATPEAIAFSHRPSINTEFASQFVASAFVGGDFSQLFELPGGPIAFALGAEYRKEKANVDYDDITSDGRTFLNALQDFTPPALKVKEAYGEMYFPLLKDLPFAQELSVNVAGRVSDYSGAAASVGTVYAYNIQGIYAPIEDIRFRAAYATSVRAPTQGDLFSPLSQNFAFIADPCDSASISANSNRSANCAAAGVPPTVTAALLTACTGVGTPLVLGAPWRNCFANSQSTGFASGGNPTLTEERGKSLTLGAVIKPRFIPGLTFTVDYYNIKVKSLIAALAAQTIINLCYDSESLANPFCATVSRDPATGLFADPAVISGGVNFAAQRTKGFDFDLDYRRTFDNGDRLRLSAIATYVKSLNNFTDPTRPTEPNRQLSELGDPQWAGSFIFDYDFGDIDIRYSARYIGKQVNNALAYETLFPHTRLCPTTGVNTGITPNTGNQVVAGINRINFNGPPVPCTPGTLVTVAPNNADAVEKKWYPDVLYHDVRIGFDVGNDFRFYAGVSNILDRKPPNGLLGTAGGDPFDSFGRNFFFGVNADF